MNASTPAPGPVNAGIPTGGQFAANDGAEGEVNLLLHLRDLWKQQRAVERRAALIAGKILGDCILAEYPTATTLRLEGSDEEGQEWWYGGVEGAEVDSEELTDEMFDAISSIPKSEYGSFHPREDGSNNWVPDPELAWLSFDRISERFNGVNVVIDLKAAASLVLF